MRLSVRVCSLGAAGRSTPDQQQQLVYTAHWCGMCPPPRPWMSQYYASVHIAEISAVWIQLMSDLYQDTDGEITLRFDMDWSERTPCYFILKPINAVSFSSLSRPQSITDVIFM